MGARSQIPRPLFLRPQLRHKVRRPYRTVPLFMARRFSVWRRGFGLRRMDILSEVWMGVRPFALRTKKEGSPKGAQQSLVRERYHVIEVEGETEWVTPVHDAVSVGIHNHVAARGPRLTKEVTLKGKLPANTVFKTLFV